MATAKDKTVRVRALRSTDLMNEGDVADLTHDEHIENMITAGYLEKVDKNEPTTTTVSQQGANQTTTASQAAQGAQAGQGASGAQAGQQGANQTGRTGTSGQQR